MLTFRLSLILYIFAAISWGYDNSDLARYVNPFIGTGEGPSDFGLANAAGNTPPGAAYPFGMALWSPDTTNAAGGYRYSHNAIQGFSLTHISGRGIGCYQDIPFLPVPGAIATTDEGLAGLSAGFSHQNEIARPGYYSVRLNNNIRVELTVTRRTGLARFTFPSGTDSGTILMNAGGSAQGNRDDGTAILVQAPRRVSGSVKSGDCGGSFTYQLFFAIEFDRPFDTSAPWKDGKVLDSVWASGSRTGASLTFATSDNPVVYAKVGLSYVSVAQAYQNLSAENRGWDFDAVRENAYRDWNTRLNAIQVEGGTDDQKAVFYTALYHSYIHPSTFSDADGSYLGFENQVHIATPRVQFHNFAGWDMYRSQMPLMALIAREAGDMVQSLVNDAVQDPSGGLPRWQHANTNSGGMLGDSQDAVIASVYALGARDFDTAAALAAMEKGAKLPGTLSAGQVVRPGLQDYETLGYVSTATSDSGSLTLEYATDDFAIAQFALALGYTDKADYYWRRSQNWRSLSRAGYLVPRNADGTFLQDPQPWSGVGFCEGSLAQYSLMVPFDLRGLFDSMGGNAAAIRRMDDYFTELNGGSWSEHAFMGNEPSLKGPWAYNFAGAPYKSQQLVRRVLQTLFRNQPAGLPGNDDLGTLSAWAVFASIGIYPHTPGVGGLLVSSPLFSRITIHLPSGGAIEIEAPEAESKTYISALRVNGIEHSSSWIPWELVSNGGSLKFTLSDAPNLRWGASVSAAPPSFGTSVSNDHSADPSRDRERAILGPH